MIINKSNAALTAGVRIAAPRDLTQVDRWILTADAATLASAAAVDATAQNAFRVELPASSVTVLVPH